MHLAGSQIIQAVFYAIRLEEVLAGGAGRGECLTAIDAEIVVIADAVRFTFTKI